MNSSTNYKTQAYSVTDNKPLFCSPLQSHLMKFYPLSSKIYKLYFYLIIFKILDLLSTFIGIEIFGRHERNPLGYVGAIIGSCVVLLLLVYGREYAFMRVKIVKMFNNNIFYYATILILFIQCLVVFSNFSVIFYDIFVNYGRYLL